MPGTGAEKKKQTKKKTKHRKSEDKKKASGWLHQTNSDDVLHQVNAEICLYVRCGGGSLRQVELISTARWSVGLTVFWRER